MEPSLFAQYRPRRSALSEDAEPLLHFPASSFSVDGCLAGPAYAVPVSAQGGATLSTKELCLSLSPPIIGLPIYIVIRIADIIPESLKLCEPLFSARHITGVVRMSPDADARSPVANARFRVDILKNGGTDELFKTLETVIANAREEARLARARADAEHKGPLVPTGKHFALVDPLAPACLHLTDQVEPGEVEPGEAEPGEVEPGEVEPGA